MCFAAAFVVVILMVLVFALARLGPSLPEDSVLVFGGLNGDHAVVLARPHSWRARYIPDLVYREGPSRQVSYITSTDFLPDNTMFAMYGPEVIIYDIPAKSKLIVGEVGKGKFSTAVTARVAPNRKGYAFCDRDASLWVSGAGEPPTVVATQSYSGCDYLNDHTILYLLHDGRYQQYNRDLGERTTLCTFPTDDVVSCKVFNGEVACLFHDSIKIWHGAGTETIPLPHRLSQIGGLAWVNNRVLVYTNIGLNTEFVAIDRYTRRASVVLRMSGAMSYVDVIHLSQRELQQYPFSSSVDLF